MTAKTFWENILLKTFCVNIADVNKNECFYYIGEWFYLRFYKNEESENLSEQPSCNGRD